MKFFKGLLFLLALEICRWCNIAFQTSNVGSMRDLTFHILKCQATSVYFDQSKTERVPNVFRIYQIHVLTCGTTVLPFLLGCGGETSLSLCRRNTKQHTAMIQKASINLTRLCQTLLRQPLRFEDQGLWIFDDEMLWIFQWRLFLHLKIRWNWGWCFFWCHQKHPDTFGVLGKYELSWNDIINSSESRLEAMFQRATQIRGSYNIWSLSNLPRNQESSVFPRFYWEISGFV